MIELDQGKGGVIRFPKVCQLLEFIEKAV